jgi:rhodanese-related sulfurtransferase
VAQVLVENGFPNARPLQGGFAAWKDAGMPVEAKPA